VTKFLQSSGRFAASPASPRQLFSRTPHNTMSAQQIPNLLTLRGGGRSRGGRGRGQGGIGASEHGALAASRKDLDIQSTDTDAAVSRLSAVSLQYLDDQFARYFVNGTGTRRLPIINRGRSAIHRCPFSNLLAILPVLRLMLYLHRHLYPHYRPRYPRKCLPCSRRIKSSYNPADETNHLVGCRNGHKIL